jgi:hypothetical protein
VCLLIFLKEPLAANLEGEIRILPGAVQINGLQRCKPFHLYIRRESSFWELVNSQPPYHQPSSLLIPSFDGGGALGLPGGKLHVLHKLHEPR